MTTSNNKNPSVYTELWKIKELAHLYFQFKKIIQPGELIVSSVIAKEVEKEKHLPKKITVLDIGAGGGDFTLHTMKELSKKHDIIYHGIDVSKEQRKEFKKNAKSLPANVIPKSYLVTSWEQYAQKRKYDLIIAYHSWYGMPGTALISKIREHLTDTGVAYIVLSLDDCLGVAMMKHNKEKIYSGDNFLNDLKKLKYNYKQKFFTHPYMKKSSFIKNNKLTQVGRDYLSYTYRQTINEKLEQKILPWVNKQDNKVFKLPGVIITIKK